MVLFFIESIWLYCWSDSTGDHWILNDTNIDITAKPDIDPLPEVGNFFIFFEGCQKLGIL